MNGPQLVVAPGARVEIRDEEWVVRTVKPEASGGQAIEVTGVSELVRSREAIFLAISEFPKGRKYLIFLSFRGRSSVRPVQLGGLM